MTAVTVRQPAKPTTNPLPRTCTTCLSADAVYVNQCPTCWAIDLDLDKRAARSES